MSNRRGGRPAGRPAGQPADTAKRMDGQTHGRPPARRASGETVRLIFVSDEVHVGHDFGSGRTEERSRATERSEQPSSIFFSI